MPVAHGTDARQVGTVDSRNAGVPGRNSLQIPVRRPIRLLKAIIRQERKRRPLKACRQHYDIGVDDVLLARAPSGHALAAAVDPDAVLLDALDVAPHPLGGAGADLVHHVRVDHRRVGEDALVGGRDVLEVAVEELAQQRFRDPREEGLLPEDVEGEERVDDGVAGDDPLVASGEEVDLLGFFVRGELERLDRAGSAADDDDLLALGLLSSQLA